MKKNKIAIDVSPLNDGNSQRGVGYYTRNLVNALQKETKNNSQFQIELVTDKSKLNTNFDLIHYPFFDPFRLTLPLRKKIPIIVTVHDLIPIQFKPHFPVGYKGELYWQIQKYKLNQVDHIITVSEYSQQIIHKILHIPQKNISVTLEAANSTFKPVTDPKKLSAIKNKYHLPPKFVLYVGDINWNKNIPTLVKACLYQKIPLVIAGLAATKTVPIHPWTKDILWLQKTAMSLRAKRSNLLTLTGFVPDEDISAIYSLATVYCQPSYAEGFGLPILEAMQCGCPVIASRESSLAEVSGSAAILFNPYSQTNLEAQLKLIFSNSHLRKKYIKLGSIQAKKYSWKKTAQSTLSVYQKVLDEKL